MTNKITGIVNIFLVIVSIIPFVKLAIVFNNPRFITICFIWIGTIFLIKPSIIFEAFREIHGLGGSNEKDNTTIDIDILAKAYEYIGVLGGMFLVIVGFITTFTM